MSGAVLTVNAGSSSLKVASFDLDGVAAVGAGADRAAPAWSAMAERLGMSAEAELVGRDGSGAVAWRESLGTQATHAAALERLLGREALFAGSLAVRGIGHRIVHGGMAHTAPMPIDDALVDALAALAPLAPLHQPHNVAGVRAARAAFPGVPQVACFDTAFHAGAPALNRRFALPARWHDAGVRRYGFHGLSYESVVARLPAIDPKLAAARVVVAHLGNGASLCALDAGRPVATTMSFSPLDGLTMGTRAGSLDAAVVLYLLREGGLDVDGVERLLFRESGLLGLSGLSSDMRELEAASASGHEGARVAVDHFVEQVVQQTGRMAAALRGIDALVFTGGIGENAAGIRGRVAGALGWLLPADAVHVVVTDEEGVIARHVARAL